MRKTFQKIRYSNKLKQKFVFRIVYAATGLSVIFLLSTIYLNLGNTEFSKADPPTTPYLIFRNPELVSGTALQLGAVYKFANTAANIDVYIEINAFSGGAYLSDIDYFTAGYNDAWQPYVVAAPNTSSYIEWEIKFKVAGTQTDTTIDLLTSTAVDVDGDGGYLQEFVQTGTRRGYSRSSGCNLAITWDGQLVKATSPVANVANIDTSQHQAMFQMNYADVKSITYRTGAISTYGAEQVRQNCIMFRSFFDNNIPLPIALVKFAGKKTKDNKIKLEWITASEKNNDYFTIERSTDKLHFSEIAQINGAGNSNRELNYEYIDLNPAAASNYYRLRQTDYDGKTETFNPILVKFETSDQELTINSAYPNPFNDILSIIYTTDRATEISVSLVNLQGQVVTNQKTEAVAGRNSFNFNSLADVPTGNYFIVISGNEIVSKSIKVTKK